MTLHTKCLLFSNKKLHTISLNGLNHHSKKGNHRYSPYKKERFISVLHTSIAVLMLADVTYTSKLFLTVILNDKTHTLKLLLNLLE